MNRSILVSLPAILLVACGSAEVPDGNAALGIATFEVTETATQLDILGRATDGTTVASARLRLGEVVDELTTGHGRILEVVAPSGSLTYQNVGLEPIELVPPLDRPDVESFLHDPHVARALARWDLTIVQLDPFQVIATNDTDYGHGGTCASNWLGWNSYCGGQNAAPNGCCMQHLTAYGYNPQKVVCATANPKSKAERACFAAPACSNGTYPSCNSQAALTCPAGSAKFEIDTVNHKWACRVNNGTPCPLKALGANGCAVCTGPDTYVGTMTTAYTPGTDTCAFNNTYTLNLNVSSYWGGDGEAWSTPFGVDGSTPSSSSSAQFAPNSNVTLTFYPMGTWSIAYVSGACTATSSYGQPVSCVVNMSSPTRTVNVEFACKTGTLCNGGGGA